MPTTRTRERQLAEDIVHAAHRLARAIERDADLTAAEFRAQAEAWRQHYAAAQGGDR